MTTMGLKAEQLLAIKYLATPKRGGLTYEQIAEECGVTDQTLRNWRKDETFQAELKREANRLIVEKLADLHQAALDGFLSDPTNAAMYKELNKVAGNTTDKIEVDATVGAGTVDVNALAERLAAARGESKTA